MDTFMTNQKNIRIVTRIYELYFFSIDDGLVKLNHKARFFGEDINYGLVILKDIAHLFGVATPNINKTIVFHQ